MTDISVYSNKSVNIKLNYNIPVIKYSYYSELKDIDKLIDEGYWFDKLKKYNHLTVNARRFL